MKPKDAPHVMALLLRFQRGGDPDGQQRARIFGSIRDMAFKRLRGFIRKDLGPRWRFDDDDSVATFSLYVQREASDASLFHRKAALLFRFASPLAVPEQARRASDADVARVLWHFSAVAFLIENKAAASVLGAKSHQDRAEKARKRVWKAARDLAEQRRAKGLPPLARSKAAHALIEPKKNGGAGIKMAARTVSDYISEMPDADDLFGPARGPKKLRKA